MWDSGMKLAYVELLKCVKMFLLLFTSLCKHKHIRWGKKIQIPKMPHKTSSPPFSFSPALLGDTVTELSLTFFMTNAKCTLWICITICKVISHPVCFHLTHGFGYFYSLNNLVQDPSSLPRPYSLHTILAAPKGTCTPSCTNAEEMVWTSKSKLTKSVSIIYESHLENWEENHFYGVPDERLDYCQVESLSWKQMLQWRICWICWKGRKPICKLGWKSN